MKKLFFILITAICFLPLFQNCGKQTFHGNGDPYEIDNGDSRVDVSPDFQSELPNASTNQAALQMTRTCTGSGLITLITFTDMPGGATLISFTTNDNKQRSIKSTDKTALSISLNIEFDSGLQLKSLNIVDNHASVEIVSEGAVSYEQFNCSSF
ncbi:MAG: hypothetical protein H6623_04310 [Bdellovibrionaceae bacterium]|nr:hypothetical protein [Pseudobdellovibrionaceae bacterium]